MGYERFNLLLSILTGIHPETPFFSDCFISIPSSFDWDQDLPYLWYFYGIRLFLLKLFSFIKQRRKVIKGLKNDQSGTVIIMASVFMCHLN